MRRGSRKGATEAASWPQASAVFPAIDATLNRRWRERERKGGNLRERLTRITKREREVAETRRKSDNEAFLAALIAKGTRVHVNPITRDEHVPSLQLTGKTNFRAASSLSLAPILPPLLLSSLDRRISLFLCYLYVYAFCICICVYIYTYIFFIFERRIERARPARSRSAEFNLALTVLAGATVNRLTA